MSGILFHARELVLSQIPDQHHGLLEMNVHWTAGVLIFAASLIGVLVVCSKYRRMTPAWPALASSFLNAGLIGAGEAFEHAGGVFNHDFWHYLHMVAGLLAVYFLWRAMKLMADARTERTYAAYIAGFAALIIIPVFLASLAETNWDPVIEWGFFLVAMVPTLVMGALALMQSRRLMLAHARIASFKSFIAMQLGLFTWTIIILTTVIFAGRVAAQIGNGFLYIWTHALQDVLLAATGMFIIILAYTFSKTAAIYQPIMAFSAATKRIRRT
ncbi:hypothetical protein HY493_00725 [Candidatus Woesearchaeota archaeon]|nr:hypothetical protein [Candidatus Woesearchaeota archaeon]